MKGREVGSLLSYITILWCTAIWSYFMFKRGFLGTFLIFSIEIGQNYGKLALTRRYNVILSLINTCHDLWVVWFSPRLDCCMDHPPVLLRSNSKSDPHRSGNTGTMSPSWSQYIVFIWTNVIYNWFKPSLSWNPLEKWHKTF